MVKKWLLSILVAFTILFVASVIVSNTNISFDKDSNYIANLPKEMRVAVISNGNDRISNGRLDFSVDKVSVPEIGDEDVLVAVKSASMNDNDFEFFRKNPNRENFVPCSDFAGVVVNVGKDVKLYEIGDKVMGTLDVNSHNGACADYVVAPQNNIYVMPYSLSFKQAATIPTPALLNWFAVHNLERSGFKKGKVLVDDAISDVGIMLTGLLSRSGFDVVAIDEDGMETSALSLGIKEFIGNSKFTEKKDVLKNSFDVVINLKRGQAVEDLLTLVKKNGTFISFEKVNASRDDIRTLIINHTYISKDVFAKMARLVHLAKLQVSIAKEYKLEQIGEAFFASTNGGLNGRVIVNISR